MITIEPWVLTLIIVCVIASVGSVAYLIGTWRSPLVKAAKDEVDHWKGRYHRLEKDLKQIEGALEGDAPLGSQNGLAELASMFLGDGEKFSLGGVLKALKENPELITQLLGLLKQGTVPRNGTGPKLPAGVSKLKPLG